MFISMHNKMLHKRQDDVHMWHSQQNQWKFFTPHRTWKLNASKNEHLSWYLIHC